MLQPDRSARALTHLARPLPMSGPRKRSRWMGFALEEGRLLIASTGAVDPAEWARMSADFTPLASATVSRSSSDGHRAILVAPAGPAGVDVEALDRFGRSTTSNDAWLADAERTMVEEAPDPVFELACHWVLKEAYGKALGVGLALPLEALSFASEDKAIVLKGAAAPGVGAGWRFELFRRDDIVLAVAYQ